VQADVQADVRTDRGNKSVMSDKIIVCMPMRDKMRPETAQALRDNMDGFDVTLLHEIGKPVRQARNALAQRVSQLRLPPETPVLWSDDDAWWLPGTIAKMVDALNGCPSSSAVFGLACARDEWCEPMATRLDLLPWSVPFTDSVVAADALYKQERSGIEIDPFRKFSTMMRLSLGLTLRTGPLRDDGRLVRLLTAASHFFIHRASLFTSWDQTLLSPGVAHSQEPFTAHPTVRRILNDDPVIEKMHEDETFCLNMFTARNPIFVMTTAVIAHVDKFGNAFVPLEGAMRVKNNALVPIQGGLPWNPNRDKRKYGLARDTMSDVQQDMLGINVVQFFNRVLAYHRKPNQSESARRTIPQLGLKEQFSLKLLRYLFT
jgi:hypothetical protein